MTSSACKLSCKKSKMIFVMWIHCAEFKEPGLTTNAKSNLDTGKVTHSKASKSILWLRKATVSIPDKSLNGYIRNTLKGKEIYKLEILMGQNCHGVEEDCVLGLVKI